MTDFSDPTYIEGQVSLEDMVMYPDMQGVSDATHISSLADTDNFAFNIDQAAVTKAEMGDEGFFSHYIPQAAEAHIDARQAAHYTSMAQAGLAEGDPTSPAHHFGSPRYAPEIASTSPATMNEFFQMMSQPEHVHAYMSFLQKQHEQQQQVQNAPLPPRSRSNSQPPAPPTHTSFASRPASTELSSDIHGREKKLAKYRTKRARRLTSSQVSSLDSSTATTPSSSRDAVEVDRFMPTAKVAKTLTHDLELRLCNAEDEAKRLRNALESREAELQLLRQVVLQEQQFQEWAMQFDASSNASSSATSPRPRSPSSSAMVSSPSNASIGSSAMDTDYTGSMDASSIGSDHHMLEVMAQAQRRQEKLKQLGGPPSDVYHPWLHGTPSNHPAFQQKEDWQSFELRPQERLARERLNYFVMMQRHRMEQSELMSQMHMSHSSMVSPSTPAPAGSVPHTPSMQHDVDPSENPHATHPYTHQPPSFYQSPHQSHILTGSPVQSAGYWSGHFAPSTAEKIDFSKISLRKTSSDGRLAPPSVNWPTHASLAPPHTITSPTTHTTHTISPNSPSTSPLPLPLPTHFQTSPTAQIWREAMAHPEMHRLPAHFTWAQSPPTHRPPFRRQANPASLAPSPQGNQS